MQTQYDPRTAVTFPLAGVGLGALLAMVMAPRERYLSMATGTLERECPPWAVPLACRIIERFRKLVGRRCRPENWPGAGVALTAIS